MNTYVTNKLLSFAGVFACIAMTYAFFGNTVSQWQAILLSIVIFGYGHFLLGFYYQLKGFARKEHAIWYYTSFVILVVLSLIASYVLFVYAGFAAALFIGFLYFLFHGLLNEQTLIERQTGRVVPLSYLTALAIFVISLLTYSVPDQTFFFDRQLQFQDLNSLMVRYIFEQYYLGLAYFTQIFWIGFSISLAVLGYAWWCSRMTKLTLFLAAVIIGSTAMVATFGPPAYIYMYVFVVGYHFMTWLLFYLVEMRKRGWVPFRNFVFHNLLILIPFVYAAHLFLGPQPPDAVFWIFDYFVFVTATYVHISTSFMNDQWFVSLQERVFTRLGYFSS
jgi:hypothetical protein